ncbi:MAG: transglutaminase-like domain-containing protein [Butyrivibrio hungatei]|nr:transglutaminase-like domain-containing protein [Butyrivibrio hungatei]
MTEKHGSLSLKIPGREKILSVFAIEAVCTLFAFAFAAVFAEICSIVMGDGFAAGDNYFSFWTTLFFMLFTALYYIFRLFISGIAAAVFSTVPALFLFFLLKDLSALPVLLPAMILGVVLRLAIHFISNREKKLLYAALILDIIALALFIGRISFTGDNPAEKVMCICLVALTLSAVQTFFYESNSFPFPIYYFLIIAIITMMIPMKKEPIDWTKAVDLGQRFVYRIESIASDISYRFSFAFGDSYTAGYSSFTSTGKKIVEGERTQLIIETGEKPYYTYLDEETGKNTKLRKTLYLAGGRGADKMQFAKFIAFLHANGVDRERVFAFTEVSNIELEYAYIDTKDVIVPSRALLVTEGEKKVREGVSEKAHRKGYRISVKYLDIDYASPELTSMLKDAPTELPKLTYDEVCDYVSGLWGIQFTEMMSRDEYEEALAEIGNGAKSEYLDVTGVTPELKELADKVTSGAESDYDKCRFLEEYLRQYPYSKDAVGGYNSESNMSTAEGMADIAERFLFDTKKGYCVHYTSSMIMLLRLSGIPARAASGFRYAFPFDRKDKYEVSSGCAHVWPEAYIENVGWIPFEPTGAYYALSATSWHRSGVNADDGWTAEYHGGINPYDSSKIPAHGDEEGEDEKVSALLAFKVFLPTVIFTAAIIITLALGVYLIKILRYRYGTPRQKLFYDVEQIKKSLIKHSGGTLSDRGLLSDFKEAAPEDIREELGKVFDVFYRVVYGNGDGTEPTAEENELAFEMRKKLMR